MPPRAPLRRAWHVLPSVKWRTSGHRLGAPLICSEQFASARDARGWGLGNPARVGRAHRPTTQLDTIAKLMVLAVKAETEFRVVNDGLVAEHDHDCSSSDIDAEAATRPLCQVSRQSRVRPTFGGPTNQCRRAVAILVSLWASQRLAVVISAGRCTQPEHQTDDHRRDGTPTY